MSYTDLPVVNAILNSLSTLFLVTGFIFIRKGNRSRHRLFMIAAVSTSCAFLISYLIYHAEVGSVRFQSPGFVRVLYFSLLLSHTVLAVTLPVLVPITLVRALRERFDRHRKIARITLPVWLYVSATGVLIYFMLYVWYG